MASIKHICQAIKVDGRRCHYSATFTDMYCGIHHKRFLKYDCEYKVKYNAWVASNNAYVSALIDRLKTTIPTTCPDCIICTEPVLFTQHALPKSCGCRYAVHIECYERWRSHSGNRVCLMCRPPSNVTRARIAPMPVPSAPPMPVLFERPVPVLFELPMPVPSVPPMPVPSAPPMPIPLTPLNALQVRRPRSIMQSIRRLFQCF